MDCLTHYKDFLDFEEDGFINTDIQQEQDCLKLRTNIKSKDEFLRWKEIFCLKTNMCFNRYKSYSVGARKLFRQKLICHHGVQHKGVKKTSTGCKVFMEVTIRIVHRQSPQLMKDFPCFVEIQGHHNHSTESADALNELRVLKSTKEIFQKYFEQGMTTAQAHRHHICKMDLHIDLFAQSNHGISPTSRSVEYMRGLWLKKEHGGLNNACMFDAIQKYAKDNSQITLEIDHDDHGFCVVLITPFMRRAHKEPREAGEVVFVDATCRVDQPNTAVIPFLCAGPAGAVPLAILFTSSQDGVMLTKGFGMIKKALGESAFFGRGAPQSFMTDNCDAERKALAATWPSAQLFLCIFHLLQQVWRWLLDAKHAIQKHDRQELMTAAKALVYAGSKTVFEEEWSGLQDNPLAKKYSNFISYLTSLVQRKEEWAIAFRAGAMLRGHHTNNFCESTMAIIKDIVLSRCKAYNTSQLIVFMVEIFDQYMSQRLVDVALNRRRVKPVSVVTIPMEAVNSLGAGKFQVQSQTEEAKVYCVDLAIGMCSCPKGENGAICKHQIVCAEHSMTVVPQMLVINSESRRWLAALALGEANTPGEEFFKPLNGPESLEMEVNIKIENQDEPMVAIEDPDFEDFKENIPMEAIEDPDFDDFEENIPNIQAPPNDQNARETSARVKNTIKASSRTLADALVEVASCFGDESTDAAINKFLQRVKAVRSSNQLNSLLHTAGSSLRTGGAGRGKIPCQPATISRRSIGSPRGAASLCKGRRPNAITPSQRKRPRNLAQNIKQNVANGKSHGSGH